MIRHAGSRLPKLVYLAAVTLLGGFGIMLLANTGNVGNSSVNTEFQQEDSFSYMTLFFGLLVLVYLGVLLGLGWHLNANNDKVELVMREVSEPFGAIPRFIHTPLFPTAIVVAIGIFWVLGAVLLLGLDSTALTVVLGGYQLYGLLVCLEVLYGLTVATVSGCVASWYWGTPDESLKVCSEDEISNSYFRVGLSSFGTVARCAFIMAVFRPVLSFLRRLRRCGSSGEGTPGCRHAAHTCCRCCLAVAESTKMMDNRAHIQMAVHGTDWADSKTLSYQIFYRNRGKVEFASLIASKMLFVVSAMNTVIAGLVTFVWLAYDDDIYSPIGPTIIVMVFAEAIGSMFSALYQFTIETIMECFCEDTERNDGSFMKPFYMTPGLKQLLLKELTMRESLDEKEQDDLEQPQALSEEQIQEEEKNQVRMQALPTQVERDMFEEDILYYQAPTTN
eukprot:TRINITY_DN8885_c0_g1_i10.p1 TRINITY_DN8885_c0_g1~~TRINITY_DN8885_c0_g1_i10.p1  ORF type:complete len:447 (+),score=119.20 TRINITY_DN8885_c0_g1_i10:425-1765(+)